MALHVEKLWNSKVLFVTSIQYLFFSLNGKMHDFLATTKQS